MSSSQKLRYEPQLIVDHVSPHGARVTQVRGVVFQGLLQLLKERGHFDDYAACLSPEFRDDVLNALASTWLPVGTAQAHYDALERMLLSDAQIAALSEALGANLFDNLFATIVRAVRSMGTETGIWFGFKQAERVFARVYHGGACQVWQVGPKDVQLHLTGLPVANSRCSRLTHCAFLRGVLGITTKACVVKCESAADRSTDRLALLISWV